MRPAPKPVTSTTQLHLDIEDIVKDVILLKGGGACIVLEVSAINFGLLSENEQDASIYAYAQLLNSLTFPIQIVIISKQKDISDYLNLLDVRITKATSPLLKNQLIKYKDFVKSVVRQGNVLDKKFYVAIPYSTLESGGSPLKMFSKPSSATMISDATVDRAVTNLAPKRDHLVRLFARIGLKARQLKTADLMQIFFDLYNRDAIGSRVPMPRNHV